jgi:hypothetical protein
MCEHPCLKRDSNPRSKRPRDHGLHLRPLGHWDRPRRPVVSYFFFTHPYINNNNYHAPRNLSLYIYLLVFIYKLNIPLALGLRDVFSSRVSSGSLVSDYGLDDRAIVVRFLAKAKDFSCRLCVQVSGWGPPSLQYNGYRGGPFLGGKARQGCDADHSSPSSAEVVNE